MVSSQDLKHSIMVQQSVSNFNDGSHLPPVLGQLPLLKHLVTEKMNQMKRVGTEIVGSFCSSVNQFPSLETLLLQKMLEWKEWNFPVVKGQKFHRLQELRIQRCPKLKKSLPNYLPPTTEKLSSEDNLCLHNGNRLLLRKGKKSVDLTPRLIQELESLDTKVVQPKVNEISSQHFEHEGAPEIPLNVTEGSYDTDDPISVWYGQDSMQDTPSPESLKVSEFSQLLRLPRQLHSLKIEGCYALHSLPEKLMHDNPYLIHLHIIDCCYLESFQGGHLPSSLKSLYILNCDKLKFPTSAETMQQNSLLEYLSIGNSCGSLTSFPLAFFPKLRSLSIWDSENFSSISITADHMSLDTLEIRNCPKLVSFPSGGLRAPNLMSITLSNCKNLKVLPDQLCTLVSLQSLYINECPELESIPEGGFPCNLNLLCISSCNKLTPHTKWGMHTLNNLSCFEIEGGCRDFESFPTQNLLPSDLNSLRISKLPNLKLLNYKALHELTSLSTLKINSCDKLRSLPEEGMLSSLTSLYINDCSLLKSKLQKKRGKMWYKIAHIPCIQIDEEEIH